MVYLTPRFLVLAALVATAAMPSFVLQTDARAIGLVERHHDKSSHLTHSPSSLSSKGKGEVQERPTIPLPPSAKGRTGDSAKEKKHRKGGRKHQDREMFVPRSDEWVHSNSSIQVGNTSIDEGIGQSFSNTRRLLDDVPQRDESQATFSLHKRGISRIYGKRERKIEEMERQEMLDAARAKAAYHGDTWDQFDPHLKVGKYVIGNGRQVKISETHNLSPRSPEPHHHHGHHHHQDKVIVNGDHDDVRIHERRTSYGGGPGHHELVTNKLGAGGEFEGATPVGRVNEPRSPHHHHHHHHHHDNHDEVVVNGDDDKVRVHERREPHHHHHHHHGEHKTVINGDNDNVHIHSRGTNVPIDADCGDASKQRKRSDALDNMSPGVPGTVDIMTADGPVRQKLASLIMSSVENSASGSTPLNGTKATSDVDSDASPFVLDASNTTQTQFFLVASSQPAAPALSVSSSPLANTLSVLKAAASSKNGDSELRDVSVMLQVLVFEPKEAAMRSYCATYDPSPPAPAPLYMNRCFSDKASDPESAGKMTESSLHKSQIFAYNPFTGTVRPRWISVTGGDAVDSSEPDLTSLNNATSSTSDREERQMNFKIPSSNKYAPQHMAGQESPLANGTQTLNETVASVPSPSSLPETPDPQNVTLVFTPSASAVHVVSSLSNTAAFKPATDTSGSDSGSDSTSDEDADDGDASPSSSTTASLDSASGTTSDSATTSTIDPGPSDMPAEKVDVTSDATDSYDGVTATASASTFTGTDTDSSAESTSASVSDPSSSSEESAVVPTDLATYIIDEAAIEKMYQEPRLT